MFFTAANIREKGIQGNLPQSCQCWSQKRERKSLLPPPPKQKSIHMFFTFNIQIFDTAGTAAVAAAAPAPLLQDRPWVEDRAKSVTHCHQCFGADQPRIFAGGRQVSGQG